MGSVKRESEEGWRGISGFSPSGKEEGEGGGALANKKEA